MTALPDGIPGFTDQVAGDSTSIQDADVRGLLATGLDEEAVFEAIVAAALGSSLVRLERVDVLLDAGS
jgi:alkylhydroperoxidase family enzyme